MMFEVPEITDILEESFGFHRILTTEFVRLSGYLSMSLMSVWVYRLTCEDFRISAFLALRIGHYRIFI